MGEPILAIDYGTCSARAALAVEGRIEPVREPASGSVSWPASVFADGGNLIVGTLAERRKRIWPAAYRGEIKRDLARDGAVPLDGRGYPARVLVTAVLGALKAEAEQQLGGQALTRAVVTVPASYDPAGPLRRLMIAAAEAAGFVDVDLLAEPVAAAWSPLVGAEPEPGSLMLVYDLGGGTFEGALVSVGENGRHEMIAHAALHDCGGRDLNQILFDEILGLYGPGLEPLSTRRASATCTKPRPAAPATSCSTSPARSSTSSATSRSSRTCSARRACWSACSAAGSPSSPRRPWPARWPAASTCWRPPGTGRTSSAGYSSSAAARASRWSPTCWRDGSGSGTDWPGQQLFSPVDPELAVVLGAAAWASSVSTRRTTAARPNPVLQPAR